MSALRFTSLLLGATAAAAAMAALRLGIWQAGVPGPGLFPLIASLMLFVTSIFAALHSQGQSSEAPLADRGRLLRIGLAISAFGIGFATVGAVLATFAFMVGVLRGIERLGWVNTLSVSIALAVLSWVVFRQLLGVPLPAGLLGVR